MTDPREIFIEADAEDRRDAVDDDQADWLAQDDQVRG
jgi:hypothetical protein